MTKRKEEKCEGCDKPATHYTEDAVGLCADCFYEGIIDDRDAVIEEQEDEIAALDRVINILKDIIRTPLKADNA